MPLKEILARESHSVVLIETFDEDGGEYGQASGVALRRDGVIITNLHTLEHACDVLIQTDGETTGSLVQSVTFGEKGQDLVILRLENQQLRPATLGKSTSLSVGDKVVAIGNPMGLENSVSEGILSARRHLDGRELLQMTAPISPGSSGGGLYDSHGRLVGITTSTLRESQSLNFAIPVEQVLDLLAKTDDKSSLVPWSTASSHFCGKGFEVPEATTIIALIGQPLFSSQVTTFLTKLNGGIEPSPLTAFFPKIGEAKYFLLGQAGLQIIFSDGTGQQVIFYLKNEGQLGAGKKGKPFNGTLPFGLPSKSNRADVLGHLGSPLYAREKGDPHTSDVFVIGDKRYFFQYTDQDEVSSIQVSLR